MFCIKAAVNVQPKVASNLRANSLNVFLISFCFFKIFFLFTNLFVLAISFSFETKTSKSIRSGVRLWAFTEMYGCSSINVHIRVDDNFVCVSPPKKGE